MHQSAARPARARALSRALAPLAAVLAVAAASCADPATAPPRAPAGRLPHTDLGLTPGAAYYLHNACSGKVLDVAGASTADGARVHLWTATGGANQQWTLAPAGDGSYTLTSVNGGKALDAFGWGTANGAAVGQWAANGGANQHWRIVEVGSGYAKLNPVHALGKALDVDGAGAADGTRVQLWDDNGSCAQQWRFERVGTSTASGHWLAGASGWGVGDGSFAAWLGHPLDIVGTWEGSNADAANFWQLDAGAEFGAWQQSMDVAVAPFSDPGESWAAAASGDYDARWRASLATLKAKWGARPGTVHLRFAWEMNGYWEPWKVDSANVRQFKSAWQRYRAIQQEVFPTAKLVFCVNRNSDQSGHGATMDWRQGFPGAQYVDVLCVDYYNNWPVVRTQADWDASMTTTDAFGAPWGLEQHRRFAESQGLPLALGEWSGNADNGDDPVFVQNMFGYLTAHAGTGAGGVRYEVLYNAASDNDKYIFYPQDSGAATHTHMPLSSAAYRQLWSTRP